MTELLGQRGQTAEKCGEVCFQSLSNLEQLGRKWRNKGKNCVRHAGVQKYDKWTKRGSEIAKRAKRVAWR